MFASVTIDLLSLLIPLILDWLLLPALSCHILFPLSLLFCLKYMQVTSTVIITTKAAAKIAKKMESPIARPTWVDAVVVVEDSSVLNAVCVLGGDVRILRAYIANGVLPHMQSKYVA